MSIIDAVLILLFLPIPSPPAVHQEIVVTAARWEQPLSQASAALTVLGREDLDRLPADSLSEVLAFVPGVTFFFESGTSGQPMLSSRGFFGGGEVEYVKVLVDGVPLGDAESGNIAWQSFRASDLERIEFLHGPGSALYGDTALGGVVQLFTSREQPATGGDVRLVFGNFGSSEKGVRFLKKLNEDWFWSLSGDSWDTDGFRENAAADGYRASVQVQQLNDRWRARFEATGDRQKRQQPGALTREAMDQDREASDPIFRFDQQKTERGRLGVTLDIFGTTPIRAAFYGLRRDDDNLRTLLLAPGFGTSALRTLTTDVGGASFEISREVGNSLLRAGMDLERSTLSARYAAVNTEGEPGETLAAEDERRELAGFFATGAWTFAQRWSFSAGLRQDNVRDRSRSPIQNEESQGTTSSAWSPRAGLNLQLGPAGAPVALFLQWSHAFKVPTLDQLFDPRPYPDGNGGFFTISNPDLRPQRARNLELGLSRNTAQFQWSLVGYRMNVRDEIDFDPQTFTYRNLGGSFHRGVEASFIWALNPRFSPRLTYAWSRVSDGETSRQLKNIPQQSLSLMLHGRLAKGTDANLSFRWRDRLSLDDDGNFHLPPVSRVDLRLTRDLKQVRLYADVLNLLDTEYSELGYQLLDFTGQPTALEFPAPGRAYRLGMTWKFPSP